AGPGRLRRLPARRRRQAGARAGAGARRHRAEAAFFRHLRRHAADGPARARAWPACGAGLARRLLHRAAAGERRAQGAAYGLERARVDAAGASGAAWAWVRRSRLFRAFLSRDGRAAGPGARDHRLWHTGGRHDRPRQSRRHAIPCREEPAHRLGAARQFLRLAAMILYPAIDLKGGNAVRLLRGDMAQATVFNTDPAAQARRFAAEGCRWLHVVDLDGAFAGKSVNGEAVRAILEAVSVPVQLGGGIRDAAAIDAWLGAGIARIVLGTAALRDPDLVRRACKAHPGRIAVGIDARGGKVAVQGWAETSDMSAGELAKALEDAGAAAIIYTDIDRDGALEGVNLDATLALARATRTPVIASGGVSSIADIEKLKAVAHLGIAGVICGRALYDGRLDLKQALSLLDQAA